MLEALAGLGGGALGMIGSGVKAVLGAKAAKAEREHQRAERAHQLEVARLASESEAADRASARVAEAEERSHQSLRVSLEAAAAQRSGVPWVEAVVRLTRPGLTTLLVILAFVFFCVDESMRRPITLAVISMAATAVTWWFGDRPVRR